MEKGTLVKQKCPACGNHDMNVFFEIESAPVFCNILYGTPQEAMSADRAPIHLGYCSGCEMICNIAFDPVLVEYCPDYENSLHYSPRFQQYAANIADSLVNRYQLYGKDVIEIGCGQGDFLAMLQRLGGNRAVGFDPSYKESDADVQSFAVKIVSQAYCRVHSGQPVDFICCRQVLEHIDQPLDFVRNIHLTIAGNRDVTVYFEVPNAMYTLKDRAIWDIIYEHYSYFNRRSLTNLFVTAGFEPMNVSEQYEGQFISIEARPANGTVCVTGDMSDVDTASLVREFKYTYDDKVNAWLQRLLVFAARRKRVVLWGAGSKGISFLNALNVSTEQVRYIVDVNPRKHGRFVPGTAQEVVSPDHLKLWQPDIVIVMNAVYLSEIERILGEMAVSAEIVVA